jgi:hypothetical protein
MAKLGRTKEEDRSRAIKYETVGRALLRTARDLDVMGEAKYGNGLAIVAIHSAIAYADALTVAYRGIKSTDGEHLRAVEALVYALGPLSDSREANRLRAILDAKSHASYGGNFYTLQDGREILLELERFAAWAEDLLVSRPPE